ncbi:toll/interleukin-1 receptor domain-containing protein [Leptolyngbya sp. FACHB-541]|uniref:toll/interleukin-1 receptor domain-containing protein n=1 Tax=Leptolyngbya sp. FACHB-541 TaxID=2692810 RepID=UPI00168A0A8A|nr:toll/interleukin-1 receptor domain-containing protein [Leptolyngbya sp. FACHB-541]MBD1999183.1 toll/interleukin-1 receptor domain-containing protein [Leptolyngbya sp. FACHB-541]
MADIFISYSRRDKEFVRTLHRALSQSQRDTWVDWEDIPVTAEWWKEIEAGIEGADTFIFVISPDSVASKICYQEVEHAAKLNKRLFPIVRREGFAIERVHEALQKHNWLFFREEDDFDYTFETLIKAVDTDLDHVRTHTRLLVKAIEWDDAGRNDGLLLRGGGLAAAEQWLKQSDGKAPQPTEQHKNYITKSRQAENAIRRTKLMVGVGAGVMGVMLAIATTTGLRAQQQIETTRSEISALRQEKADLETETNRAIRNLRLAEAKQQQAVDAANQANQDLQAAVKRETEAQEKAKAAQTLAAQAQQTQQQAETAAAEAERKQQAAETAAAEAQQSNVQSSTAYEKTLEDLREQWQRGDRQDALIRLAMARICQLEGRGEEADLRACIRETLDVTRSQISE